MCLAFALWRHPMPQLTLSPGASAPAVSFEGEQGQAVMISELWASAQHGIVLSFLRHYG